jgi:hypothetical protein
MHCPTTSVFETCSDQLNGLIVTSSSLRFQQQVSTESRSKSVLSERMEWTDSCETQKQGVDFKSSHEPIEVPIYCRVEVHTLTTISGRYFVLQSEGYPICFIGMEPGWI